MLEAILRAILRKPERCPDPLRASAVRLDKARAAYDKARAAYDKARAEFREMLGRYDISEILGTPEE